MVDTDQLARDLVEPGEAALAEIAGAFGVELVGPDGRLRRDLLAERVFANPEARKKLESILHPRIRARWQAQAARWRAEARALGVVVIPLLFETAADDRFDATVCVACTAATQAKRLAERGWNPSQIAKRMKAQMSIEEKMTRSNYVIWTEGRIDVLGPQLSWALGLT